MLLNTDYIYPVELTGYVRDAQSEMAINKFQLSKYLPDVMTDDISVRMLAGNTGLAEAATFRTWDTESGIVRTQPLVSVRQDLPPISAKVRLSEYDNIRSRKVSDPKVRDQIFNDAETVTDSISARMELARGEVIQTGKLTMDTLAGVKTGQVIDFGRSAGNSVTAVKLWTDPTADILSDLMSWRDSYLATNGIEPGELLGSRKVWNLMLRNQAVRNQVFPGANQPSVVTQTLVNELLATQGLPPFTLYQASVRVDGVARRVLDEGGLAFLPNSQDGSNKLGATQWGPTAESFEPGYGMVDSEDGPGIVCGVYKSEDPIALWTKAAAVGLPMVVNPDLSFAAKVA